MYEVEVNYASAGDSERVVDKLMVVSVDILDRMSLSFFTPVVLW